MMVSGGVLQEMLQAAVRGITWTYSLFWQFCPEQGALVWADGFYNGAIKTRKTLTQPMEIGADEECLQRSQQLRELYESLSAGNTDQPARRPSTALSPEDLTESEWFYLMCVSFSFPNGVGLPGKAYLKQQHVWLTGAGETDSKFFPRAILAKSADIQTVACIPINNGVLELGTTEKVQEDLGIIQYAKSYIMEHHNQWNQPRPVLSEHSMFDPASSDQNIDYSPFIPTRSSVTNLPAKEAEAAEEANDDETDKEEDAELGLEDKTMGENTTYVQNPLQLSGQVTQEVIMAQVAAEPIELMQLHLSEEIQVASPDDYSNIDSELQPLTTNCSSIDPYNHHPYTEPYLADSAHPWSLHQYELSDNLIHSDGPEIQELMEEDTHYTHTVSEILPQRTSCQEEPSSASFYLTCSKQSAFSKWSCQIDRHHFLQPSISNGTSQQKLKYILFTIPFLHTKHKDVNCPKSKDGEDGRHRLRKGPPQDELGANHVLAERQRRKKLNKQFTILRSLVPFVTKMDKASILGDTIEYVKQLREKIKELESQNQQLEVNHGTKGREIHISSKSTKQCIQQMRDLSKGNISENVSSKHCQLLPIGKQKKRIIEGTTNSTTKGVTAIITSSTVEVSIIEKDALLELKCPYKDALLLNIMQILHELQLEITAIHSSLTDGVFVAKIRAKVKEKINGKKASIVEVKQAIHQVI